MAVPSSLPFSSSSLSEEENALRLSGRRSESKKASSSSLVFAAKATGALLLGCSALFAVRATTTTTGTTQSASHDRFPAAKTNVIASSQRRSSAALGVDATKNKNDEWNRLHPGFCGNWTGEENEEVSPFVREAMEKAKMQVYSEYEKKKRAAAASERADATEDAVLGEEDVPWQDSPVRIHSADVLVIVQINSQKDHEDFAKIQKTLPDAKSVVGVTPTEWPQNIQDAEWAIEPIRRLNSEFFQKGWKHPDPVRNGDNLKHLMWLGVIDERQADGSLSESSYGGSHHIGCLFAHLHAWRTVLESNSGKKFSLIMEADGMNWQMKHLDAIVANVPEDADFVLLTNFYEAACAQPDEAGFCDKHGNTYPIVVEEGPKKGQHLTGNFYYWPKQRSGAGFARYLIGPKFQEKIYKYMARFGADMIDAFTFGHLCQDDYKNAQMRDEGFAMPDLSDPWQKRETSRDEQNYDLKVLNCYLTDMHPDMIYN